MLLSKGGRSRRWSGAASMAAIVLFLPSAFATTLYTNGASDQADGSNITGFVAADDFVHGGAVVLSGGTFWSSANSDPFQDQFSGLIGWAIFADNGGSPGSILFSGSDSSPVLTDTGLQIFGTEEWRIDFSFGSIVLSGGTYWLALHEGALGTPDDGTTIFWDTTASTHGALSQFTADLTAATGWSFNSGLKGGSGSDLAFQLTGSTSGPAVPEPSTVGLVGVGILGFAVFRRLSRP
jgi:hypothetical protein